MSSSEIQLIQLLVSKIDEQINQQINAILHHPEFQRLESAWRGLAIVVNVASGEKKVVVRVLNISLRELYKDLSGAIEFDHSQFYKKVYSLKGGMKAWRAAGLPAKKRQ